MLDGPKKVCYYGIKNRKLYMAIAMKKDQAIYIILDSQENIADKHSLNEKSIEEIGAILAKILRAGFTIDKDKIVISACSN